MRSDRNCWALILAQIGCIVLASGTAIAQPAIEYVSGHLIHGTKITIKGAGFGIKEPPSPLLWDDGEGKRTEDDSAISSAYDEVWPILIGAPAESHRTRYRNVPFRKTDAPHAHSGKYIAGGHYQPVDNNPPYIGGRTTYRSVMLTKAANEFEPRWFAMFYYRLDPLWHTPCYPGTNHKISSIQSGKGGYDGKFFYMVWNGHDAPCGNASRLSKYSVAMGCGESGQLPFHRGNPRMDWIHWEERIANDAILGMRDVYIDNFKSGYFQKNCPNWFTPGIRSYSVGGYYRWCEDIRNTSTYRGDSNHFRYFDDIYIDTNLSRVILGNDPVYSKSTVVEPQIPQSWENNAITVTVNLGRLPDHGNAYLFVFDSNNTQNPKGYPVKIGN